MTCLVPPAWVLEVDDRGDAALAARPAQTARRRNDGATCVFTEYLDLDLDEEVWRL